MARTVFGQLLRGARHGVAVTRSMVQAGDHDPRLAGEDEPCCAHALFSISNEAVILPMAQSLPTTTCSEATRLRIPDGKARGWLAHIPNLPACSSAAPKPDRRRGPRSPLMISGPLPSAKRIVSPGGKGRRAPTPGQRYSAASAGRHRGEGTSLGYP